LRLPCDPDVAQPVEPIIDRLACRRDAVGPDAEADRGDECLSGGMESAQLVPLLSDGGSVGSPQSLPAFHGPSRDVTIASSKRNDLPSQRGHSRSEIRRRTEQPDRRSNERLRDRQVLDYTIRSRAREMQPLASAIHGVLGVAERPTDRAVRLIYDDELKAAVALAG
jgi:hypothetical protein